MKGNFFNFSYSGAGILRELNIIFGTYDVEVRTIYTDVYVILIGYEIQSTIIDRKRVKTFGIINHHMVIFEV